MYKRQTFFRVFAIQPKRKQMTVDLISVLIQKVRFNSDQTEQFRFWLNKSDQTEQFRFRLRQFRSDWTFQIQTSQFRSDSTIQILTEKIRSDWTIHIRLTNPDHIEHSKSKWDYVFRFKITHNNRKPTTLQLGEMLQAMPM